MTIINTVNPGMELVSLRLRRYLETMKRDEVSSMSLLQRVNEVFRSLFAAARTNRIAPGAGTGLRPRHAPAKTSASRTFRQRRPGTLPAGSR
jgi:hypothetical protein